MGKEKKKKSKTLNEENVPINNQKPRRNDIFSKLDNLDIKSKEEIRATEEKLRRGLIESEATERERKKKKSAVKISEIKQEIERLKNIKIGLYKAKDYEKSIETAKKIITIAEKNEMSIILNEEKKFIDTTQKILTPNNHVGNKIEELKILRHTYYSSGKYDEAIQIANVLIELASEADLDETVKAEESFIALLQGKINQKSPKVESFESLKNLEVVEQKQAYTPNITQKSEINLDSILAAEQNKIRAHKVKIEEEKEKSYLEKREFETNKESFMEEQRKFKEEREIYKSEKINFEEEKENFNQEKLSFEEVKEILNAEKREFESNKESTMEEQRKFKEEREIFEQEKIKLEKEKENFYQEKQIYEERKENLNGVKPEVEFNKEYFIEGQRRLLEEKETFEQEKINFEEEKENFNQEKLMFEEVKKKLL